MKKQINPNIKAHLLRSAFYLILLLAVGVIPFSLAQRNSVRSPSTNSAVTTQSASAPGPHVGGTGPLSKYFLTAGDQGTNWTVQGNAVVNSWAQHHPEDLGEYAISVTATMKTLHNGNDGQCCGSEYRLDGTYTGTDFAYPPGGYKFYDGASDGTHNYSIDYFSGGVYRMNADWSSPTLLFNAPSCYLGITYDRATDTLWISQFCGSTVEHRSLSGAILSSFTVPFTSVTCLAIDPADATLWMGTQNDLGTFYQYSQAGALLNTATYTELIDQNTLGGEFQTAPTQITLRAEGRKVNGVDTVRLTWSGATSSQVDIYRCVQRVNECNPAVIATTANDGRYIDSTGHTGQAGFRYKVCEAGTQTCSKAAGVTFER